jgi:hypothetical protein
MDNEEAIRAEMRLWALEVLVCDLFAVMCASDPAPLELFERTRDQMISGARQRTFGDFDAAQSDLFSAELEAAVTRLMDMVGEQIRRGRA